MKIRTILGVMSMLFCMVMYVPSAVAASEKSQTNKKNRTTDGFKQCVDANQSPIFPGNKLVNLCLDRHEAEMPPNSLEASGAYVKVDAQTQFALRVRNTSNSMMVTRFLVILKHDKADKPQIMPVGPVSLLPGEVTNMRLGGLDYVPDSVVSSGAPDFKFSVDTIRGLELNLR